MYKGPIVSKFINSLSNEWITFPVKNISEVTKIHHFFLLHHSVLCLHLSTLIVYPYPNEDIIKTRRTFSETCSSTTVILKPQNVIWSKMDLPKRMIIQNNYKEHVSYNSYKGIKVIRLMLLLLEQLLFT